MNITEYQGKIGKLQVVNGRMSLQNEYRFVDADEQIYRYLGPNSARPFTALIHKDDLPVFYDAVEKLDTEPQLLLIRVLNANEDYRYMFVRMWYNGRVMDGFRSIDLLLNDIIWGSEKVEGLRTSIAKYRKFMGVSNNMYFEYYYDTRTVNIFEYISNRGVVVFNDNLDEMRKRVDESSAYSYMQKAEFAALYDCLDSGKDSMEVAIDGVFFNIKPRVNIRGRIMYQDNKKYMLTAIAKIIDHVEMEKYYLSQYAIDPGTGLYNKRAISELSVDIISGADESPLYVIMLDIDYFKNINDNYGHMFGDEVLVRVSDCIKNVLNDRGYVGRFGGDEFFIIVNRIKNDEDIVMMLKTIRKNIAWSCKVGAPDLEVTTSIGIARYPDHGRNYDRLLQVADKCLYIAKAKGRNRYILYKPEVHGGVDENDNISSASEIVVNDAYHMGRITVDMMKKMAKIENNDYQEFFDELRQRFNIDGISVFAGSDYKRIITSGNYINPMERVGFVKTGNFANHFDDLDVYAVNNILELKESCPDEYEMLARQNNHAFIFVRDEMDDKSIAVEYDIFGRTRKWAEHEKGMLMMLSREIIDIFREKFL